jgi:uncharacterized protein
VAVSKTFRGKVALAEMQLDRGGEYRAVGIHATEAGDFEVQKRLLVACEFLLVFLGLPAVFALYPSRWWPLVVMWGVSIYGYLILRRQPGFRPRRFWGAPRMRTEARSILAVFLPAGGALAVAVYLLAPRLFLGLPRRFPLLWAAVMILYPVFSVLPQTLIYRPFFFHRYRVLFPSERALIVASAISFSWLHVVMRNPVAPLLTFPGGLLFAWRYTRTESLLAPACEHALYGCLVFTLGLGAYFFTVAAR